MPGSLIARLSPELEDIAHDVRSCLLTGLVDGAPGDLHLGVYMDADQGRVFRFDFRGE